MRISFLILCLPMVYGIYRTYGHEGNTEHTDMKEPLIEEIQTPDKELRLLGYDIITKTKTDLTKSRFDAIFGQAECPKIELFKLIKNPIKTIIQTLRCYIVQTFKSLINKIYGSFKKFLLNILHKVLNIVKFDFLPTHIKNAIEIFNFIYPFLQKQIS